MGNKGSTSTYPQEEGIEPFLPNGAVDPHLIVTKSHSIPYKTIKECRLCGSRNLKPWFKIKEMALVSSFVRQRDGLEGVLPLTMVWCSKCTLSQCLEVVDPETLSKSVDDYRTSEYPKLVDYFSKQAANLVLNVVSPEEITILEIGCNDGTYLKFLSDKGYQTIGVDPSAGAIEDAKLRSPTTTFYNQPFNDSLPVDDHSVHYITSSSVFDHVEDIQSLFRTAKRVLADKGLLNIEVYNTHRLVKTYEFDALRHERMVYWTPQAVLYAAKKFGFTLESVQSLYMKRDTFRYILRASSTDTSSRDIHRVINTDYSSLSSKGIYSSFRYKIDEIILRIRTDMHRRGFESGNYIAYGTPKRSVTLCAVTGIYPRKIVIPTKGQHTGLLMPWYNGEIVDARESMSYHKCLILDWRYIDNIRSTLSSIQWQGYDIMALEV